MNAGSGILSARTPVKYYGGELSPPLRGGWRWLAIAAPVAMVNWQGWGQLARFARSLSVGRFAPSLQSVGRFAPSLMRPCGRGCGALAAPVVETAVEGGALRPLTSRPASGTPARCLLAVVALRARSLFCGFVPSRFGSLALGLVRLPRWPAGRYIHPHERKGVPSPQREVSRNKTFSHSEYECVRACVFVSRAGRGSALVAARGPGRGRPATGGPPPPPRLGGQGAAACAPARGLSPSRPLRGRSRLVASLPMWAGDGSLSTRCARTRNHPPPTFQVF